MDYLGTSTRRESADVSGERRDGGKPYAECPRIASERLLGGLRELVIEHNGEAYHLRVTRNDKLILTK